MEIQDRVDSEEKPESTEEDQEEESNNRIYNGFQGPLTETAEQDARPDAAASSSTKMALSAFLVFLLLLWRCGVRCADTMPVMMCQIYSCFAT